MSATDSVIRFDSEALEALADAINGGAAADIEMSWGGGSRRRW